jgi:hypothetical protein
MCFIKKSFLSTKIETGTNDKNINDKNSSKNKWLPVLNFGHLSFETRPARRTRLWQAGIRV